MAYVRLTDVTGLTALSEAMNDCRKKKVLIALINATKDVDREISKFGIRSEDVNKEDGLYLQQFIVPAEDGRMYVRLSEKITSINDDKVTPGLCTSHNNYEVTFPHILTLPHIDNYNHHP